MDSNLLVLLLVGLTSRRYIPVHKRLAAYAVEDFELLQSIIAGYEKLLLTPNSLTETWNIASQIAPPAREEIAATFVQLVRLTEEQYVPSRQCILRTEFRRLGLADSVLLDIAAGSHVLLTADLDLYLAAARQGYEAYNFNHLREQSLGI
ncbi:MAG: hypothetical protein ACREFQ_08685 [Stellaceae bacterium]